MMFPKATKVKLKGKKLKALNEEVYKRDQGCCAICGIEVERGVKMHHEPQGALKSDEIDKVMLLCNECHYQRHHTDKCNELKYECIEYLEKKAGKEQ